PVAIFCAFVFNACQDEGTNTQQDFATLKENMKDNPFLSPSPLQYQAPQFDKINDEHYKPAFDFGMAQQLAEWDSIANNPEAPTFENTLIPNDNSGQVLTRATSVFYNLTSSHTNPTLQKLEEEYAPVFAAHFDKLYLNDKLYQRIKTIYDQRENES